MTETAKNDAEREAQIRERLAKATPGQWEDARLIANAPSDLAFLLSALDDARAAAKQDAERLDWMFADFEFAAARADRVRESVTVDGKTLRAAIDAARSPVAVRETTDNG